MSRINTNVSSLVAQKILGRTNDQLQESLNRLSTGLRINSGKDDPAGLIASENLRRDITSANKAITNTERANQLIATGDSALGQVSNLLNDIRGLVVEAANTGVLSQEQIDANQLQVDSSLEAIDRISQVTTFQGRKLLDGSLDFQVGYAAGGATVRDLDIQQANLGATGSVSVDITVTTAATQALLANTSFGAAAPAVQATGTVALASTLGSITVSATAGGAADGIVGNTTDVIFQTATVAQASGTAALTNSAGSLNIGAAAGGAADGVVGNTTDVVFQAATDIAQATNTLALTNSAGSITVSAVAGGAAEGVIGNSTDITFQAAGDIAQASGSFALTNTGGDFTISAVAGSAADGATGNAATVVISEGLGATAATYNSGTNTITVNVDNSIVGGDSVTNIAAAIGALAEFDTSGVNNGASTYVNTDDDLVGTTPLSGGSDGTSAATYNSGTNAITVSVGLNQTLTQVSALIDGLADFSSSAATGGGNTFDSADLGPPLTDALAGGSDGTNAASFNSGTNTLTVNVALGATLTQVAAAVDATADFTSTAATGGANAFDSGDFGTSNPLAGGSSGATAAAYNATTNAITVSVALGDTVTNVAAAIDSLAAFTASAASGGGNAFNVADNGTNADPLAGGVNATTGGLGADLVVKIAGATGGEVFTFETGATLSQIVNAVNLVSDATGVQASNNAGALNLASTAYGSAAFVDVEVLEEGTGGTFEGALSATRDTGSDIVATVNGVTANGNGNTLSVNTSTLDLSLTVNDGSSTAIQFTINGGGAVFQLGPQVVSNQQARIGIGSVNTGELGGVAGRLYQLRSGNNADLSTDTSTATRIVDQAINKVTGLRGRLGAFQRTSLETNIASLQDTVTNLVEAESSIRDADFAAESARLTRAQILVQSGTSVLAIANQNPQNVLSLLRG